jgi:translation initiation factor IF-2
VKTQERRAPVVKEKPTGPISLPPQIIVKDLADMLSVTPIEIIRDLINKHAIFASINQVVDYEKAALVAKDLGFEPSPVATTETRADHQLSANEIMMATRNEENMVVIPPVVTIMGHVDHGKTSLLDTIRKTKVAAGEAGGITQHIGAYQVEVNGKKITFLDTPGHEAFTAMRARGAQVTHIAIIVVAADDGVMPQTREAIDHANAAKVPIIIALNKIDKANANPDRVKQQLTEIGIIIEEYGGETVLVPVSARQGQGIDELLDYILLVAEVQDIRANPNRLATGIIIEARLEKNSGATATVLVQQGTLKMGDNIVVGAMSGKVRAMFNDRGKRIQKAPPSTPVSILGLPEVPQAGDHLEVTEDERTAKMMAQRELEKRRAEAAPLGQVSLDTLYMQMQEGTVKELDVVLKSDVQGSSEAIKGALSKLGEENMKVRLIHEGIGNVSETDVHLAGASGAVIIAFNVKADGAAQREAQREHVDIRYYEVIYKLIEDIQAALVGMLEPTYREVIDGHAEVIQIFKAGKSVVIAGCRITDGKLTRASQARVLRKTEKVYDGKVGSLRRGKDDVREVLTGYECGIVLEDFSDYEIGDIIEAFSQERVAPGA